jgi:hypothetical protein
MLPPDSEDITPAMVGWVVVCSDECNARTDSYMTPEFAADAWNRRYSLASTP